MTTPSNPFGVAPQQAPAQQAPQAPPAQAPWSPPAQQAPAQQAPPVQYQAPVQQAPQAPMFGGGAPQATPGQPQFASGAGGGGNFPKTIQLLHCLLALRPAIDPVTGRPIVETVPNQKQQGQFQDRFQVDTIVVEGPPDLVGKRFDGMYWSVPQGAKYGIGVSVFKNYMAGSPWTLGRLRRFPASSTKKEPGGAQTWEQMEQVLAATPAGQQPKSFAWGLEAFTPDDMAKAAAMFTQLGIS